jgi:simple sugar transport system permease protein
MWKRIVRSQEFIIAIGIVVLSIVITAINPNFFTVANLFDLLRFITVDGLLALGVLIVLISGGVDVSFPAIANFSTYIVVTFLIAAGFQGSVAVVYLLALPLGLLLGLVNGYFVSYFRLPTLIVTLGTSSLYYGAMLFFIGSANLFNLPAGMMEFSKAALTSVTSPEVGTTALHPSILLLLVAAVLVWLLLRYTLIGRGIFAIGGNRDVAERTGFRIHYIELIIYATAGVLAATAGVTRAALYRNVNPISLLGTELDVIAAVVLGGAAITGGSGTVIGALLGVLLLTIIRTSLVLVGIPSEWQKFVVGIVLLIGVSIPAARAARARRRAAETIMEQG